LRLQDLNAKDIGVFVRCKLNPHTDLITGKLIQKLIDRANGVSFWAVLVANSMVSGVLDGDDIEILERRLHATPSELNALFAQLLAKIDEVHYETFKLCLFHLDNRNWGPYWGLRRSINLITASMAASRAITTCAEFLAICTKTSAHLVSLGKGLIETECDTYGSSEHDVSAWTFDFTRRRLSRADLHETSMCCNSRIRFTHRSVYDFLFGHESRDNFPWVLRSDDLDRLMRLTFIGINISLRYTPMLFIETGTFIDPKFYTFMESAIGVVNSTGSGEEVDLLAWADDIHRDVGIWYPSERISIASSDFLMVGLDPSWSVEFNFWDGALLIDGYLESRWDALAQHPHARAICSRLLCNRYIRHNEPTEPTYARLSAFLDETFTKTAANALEHIGRNEGESDKISTQVSWDASSAMDDQHVIANLATAAIDNLDWAMRRASYEFSAVFALLQRQNTFVGRSQLSPGPRERFTLHIQVPLRTSWKPLRLRASRSAVRSPGYPTHYRLICLVNHRGMLRADWTPCTGVVVGKYPCIMPS
jgi:hypothetical protein